MQQAQQVTPVDVAVMEAVNSMAALQSRVTSLALELAQARGGLQSLQVTIDGITADMELPGVREYIAAIKVKLAEAKAEADAAAAKQPVTVQ